MASKGLTILGLTLLMAVLGVNSLTCQTQMFSNKKVYDNCTDLPTLGAFLHWTYDSSNSSLSVAFVAPPASENGWIAWAINPTGTGMVGAQALVAFKSNGAVMPKLLSIGGYTNFSDGKLSFDVWDFSTEQSDGVMRIFATVAVPKNATTLNQVWQVGANVSDGRIQKHSMSPANFNSKGTLVLTPGTTNATTTNSTANSSVCGSQTFSNKNVYAKCSDLPTLNASIHWTHDSSNSSLSVAFVAPPASENGWIAWAINPTGTGMVGAQALVAFKSNGTVKPKLLSIGGYTNFSAGKLSFDVWDFSTEQSDGVMRIFATVAVPKNATTLNQVWQVGANVSDGKIQKHSMSPANFNSKGTLVLTPGTTNATTTNSTANSSLCGSQTFSNKNVYAKCSDLPTLNASIHWTHDSSNSSLSVAFVAPPASENGWIAWAINPTGIGMVGAQALVAFKSNGTVKPKLLSIGGYTNFSDGKLSFDVWDFSTEQSDGVMRIFATVAVPKNATTLNQVWQVGANVSDGRIQAHSTSPANLQSKGTLAFVEGATGTTNSSSTGDSGKDSGASTIQKGFGFYLFVLLLGLSHFII